MNALRAVFILAMLAAAARPAAAQDYDRHGHALVRDAHGWMYVDRDRRPILRPYIYDNGPDYFEEGLARFVQDGKMGFHDETLAVVIPARYDFAFPFENGVARVGMRCKSRQHGEHSSVQCEQWQTLARPPSR